MNPIPKEELEQEVIKAVLDFYRPYLQKDGRKKIAEIIKQQTGAEKEDLAAARQRAEDELNRISEIIENLLDNITETNREFVDKRLNELSSQRQQLEQRLEELDRLSISQVEIQATVADSMKFISSLEFTLHKGLPQEKLAALRQCIERIWIDKPSGIVKLTIRLVPAGNLQATQEVETSI